MDTGFHFGRFNVRINGKLVQLRDNSIDFFYVSHSYAAYPETLGY